MGFCLVFWTLLALLIGVAGIVWQKSPRPLPAGAGGSPETAPGDPVRRTLLYLVGFLTLIELFFFLREGRPSRLLFALALLVYLGYGTAYAKRPPSRSVEALTFFVMLALGGASFYLSTCLGR